jgi:integrase
MKQTFSVKAVLRKDKKKSDGRCPIYYQIIINSKPLKLPSGSYLLEANWDDVKGQEKGLKSSSLNCKLRTDLFRIESYILQERSLSKFVTAEMVKAFYNNKDQEGFYEYFDEFCKKHFLKISEGTQYHYELLRKRLVEFKPNLKFSLIDNRFVKDFDYFLKVKKQCGIEGTATQHKKLRAVLTEAYVDKLIERNPYETFSIEKGEPRNESLTTDQVEKVEKMDFRDMKNAKGLEVSRDLFLFACYTGLRCQDVIDFKRTYVFEDKVISLIMKKTKHQVNIPIYDKTLDIINKYALDEIEYVFPCRTNQCLNRDLKVIAEACKIETRMSFHLARHTFGTMAAKSGMSIFDVSRLLGHRNIEQTKTYVTTDLEFVSEKMDAGNYFSRGTRSKNVLTPKNA